jgi:hypothetical protein
VTALPARQARLTREWETVAFSEGQSHLLSIHEPDRHQQLPLQAPAAEAEGRGDQRAR